MSRHFFTLDVFTNQPLAGNPLAVVLDSDGLSVEDMQTIAAEFNLSETVFVAPPKDTSNRANIRIFTPVHELPFAGHPTVGTAILLGKLDGLAGGERFVLEEQVGPVTCEFSIKNDAGFARFQLPKVPTPFEWKPDSAKLADALGITEADIGFGDHQPCGWDGGVPYSLVPVGSLEAMQAIQVDASKSVALEPEINGIAANIFAYCSGGEAKEAAFHTRMFAHSSGIPEDPATGSAVASFCGQIAALEMGSNETGSFMIEQGYEMGRPSQIYLDITKSAGAIRSAAISGGAVIVSEGKLHI